MIALKNITHSYKVVFIFSTIKKAHFHQGRNFHINFIAVIENIAADL